MGHRKATRRRRKGKPVLFGDLLQSKTRKWRFVHLAKLEIINSKWTEAAGQFVAQHVRPARLVRKQLRLAVDDSSWVAELTYLAPSILARLQELLPRPWVDELKAVPGEPMPEFMTRAPDETPKDTLTLLPITEKMTEQAQALSSKVDDPDLAKAIYKATISRLRRGRALTQAEPEH